MRTDLLITVLLFAGVIGTGIGCHKPSDTPIGGKGGKATLVVTPVHSNLNVDSCMVYLKYNATDAPANNIYDDSAKCFLQDTTPVAIFTQLKTGQYYVFGNGYHLYYNAYVKGGFSFTINTQDTNKILLATYAYY